METVNPKTLTRVPGGRFCKPRSETQEGGKLTGENADTASEMRQLVRSIEKMQAQATKNDYKFLAYLLEMARMEAVNVLHAKKK